MFLALVLPIGSCNQLPPTWAQYFSYAEYRVTVLSVILPDSRNCKEFSLALDMIQLVKVKPIACFYPQSLPSHRGRETIISLDLEPIPLLIQPAIMLLSGHIPLGAHTGLASQNLQISLLHYCPSKFIPFWDSLFEANTCFQPFLFSSKSASGQVAIIFFPLSAPLASFHGSCYTMSFTAKIIYNFPFDYKPYALQNFF